MFILMVFVFVLGYAAIALEHPIKIDKSASALLTGVLVWTVLVLGAPEILSSEMLHGLSSQDFIHHHLMEHLAEIASIIFFLLGAMTIVELVDAHGGFGVVTDKITTTNKVKLMWSLTIITFFFSAALTSFIVLIFFGENNYISRTQKF